MEPAFLFDLDGTLIDSVYCHVIAWQEALAEEGVVVAGWVLHRRVGMGSELFLPEILTVQNEPCDDERIDRLSARHDELYAGMSDRLQPLPGAAKLMERLIDHGSTVAIATSGSRKTAQQNLEKLSEKAVDLPIVTADDAGATKPNPELFLKAAERLGADPLACVAVGDSVWDMIAARRARILGVGVLCGGYGRDELSSAGALRVYDDPQDMMGHLNEFGVSLR